jgi:hypothetical protein
MDIACPSCNASLFSRSEASKILPLKRWSLATYTCPKCGCKCTSTQSSRTIWFMAFMSVIILFLLIANQLQLLIQSYILAKVIYFVALYFCLSKCFTSLWTKVISLKVKG